MWCKSWLIHSCFSFLSLASCAFSYSSLAIAIRTHLGFSETRHLEITAQRIRKCSIQNTMATTYLQRKKVHQERCIYRLIIYINPIIVFCIQPMSVTCMKLPLISKQTNNTWNSKNKPVFESLDFRIAFLNFYLSFILPMRKNPQNTSKLRIWFRYILSFHQQHNIHKVHFL